MNEVERLSALQKKLLESAAKAVKPKGIIVYSTCTLNREENEEVVEFGVSTLNLEVVDIQIPINGMLRGFDEGGGKGVEKAVRLLPSKDMEGFFICKFRRKS